MLRVCAIACGLVCAGCSFALVRPAPVDHAKRSSLDCTSSRFAPISDVVGVPVMLGTALAIEGLSNLTIDGDRPPGVKTEARVVQGTAIGLAAVHLFSAVYGFQATARCARAKELLQVQQVQRRRPLPGCASDADCKAGRQCASGACVWPLPDALEPDARGASPSPEDIQCCAPSGVLRRCAATGDRAQRWTR